MTITSSAPTTTPSEPSMKPEDTQDWLGFAAYPNARTLCVEHVAGNNMHISWRSYASKDAPEKVAAFYEPSAHKKKLELTGPDETRLSVFPATEAGNYPSCEVSANREEQTIILVSQAIR